MKKNLLIFTCIIVASVIACVSVGCTGNGGIDYDGMTAIVFELEGGAFQNCHGSFTHYYTVDDGEKILIQNPETLANRSLERTGYLFKGWTDTKPADGATVNEDELWNFAIDKVGKAGATLYAVWSALEKVNYNICYVDEVTSETVVLGTYAISKDHTFKNDFSKYANKRNGYTPLGYFDVEGNEWIFGEAVEPEVAEDGTQFVNVYVKYVKGNFTVVSTAKELKTAVSGNRNVYLANDIDLEGEELSFKDYGKTFMGNGHKVSNFVIPYSVGRDSFALIDNIAYASIFGNAEDAVVEDVVLENVTIEFKTGLSTIAGINISPVVGNAVNTKISGLVVNGLTVDIQQLPAGFDLSLLTVELTEAYLTIDDESSVDATVNNIKYILLGEEQTNN